MCMSYKMSFWALMQFLYYFKYCIIIINQQCQTVASWIKTHKFQVIRRYLTCCFCPQHKLFTAVHKYYTVEEWKKFALENADILEHVAVSSGSSVDDFDHMKAILEAVPEITFICLDVANGYSQHFIDFVRKVRSAFPTHTIMVSTPSLSYQFPEFFHRKQSKDVEN